MEDTRTGPIFLAFEDMHSFVPFSFSLSLSCEARNQLEKGPNWIILKNEKARVYLINFIFLLYM